MKNSNFSTIIFTLALALNSLPLFGQYVQLSLGKKVQNSDVIIEGKILQSESFENNGKIFTSHKVKVLNPIYPLASPCATALSDFEQGHCLYIITRGGRTSTKIEHWAEALQLFPEEKGMFFLKGTNYPTLHSDLSNYEVYSEVQGFVRYELDEQVNFSGSEVFETYTNPEDELIQEIYQILNIQNPKKSYIRNDWELDYLLNNIALNGSIVSFDLNVKSKWGNPFAIKELQLSLQYNPDFFGQSILQNGNLSFSIPSDLNSEGITFSASQSATNKVQLAFVKNNANLTLAYIENDYRKIATCLINLQNVNLQQTPNLEVLQGSLQKVIDDESNQVTIASSTTRIDPKSNPKCLVGNIDNVQPLNVGAGVFVQNSLVFDANQYGGIITITGCGFGDLDEANLSANIPNNNRVVFQTILNNVGVTPFASDYLQWDDAIIRVRVPSIGYRVDVNGVNVAQIAFGLAADFGPVQVRTPIANFVSAQNLVVEFVHWNDFNGNNINNHRSVRLRHKALDHTTTQVNNNGYEYFFTPAFINNMPNGSQIETQDALNTWCVSQANFEIVAPPVEEPGFAGMLDYGALPAGIVADSRAILENSLAACENDDRPILSLGIVFSNSADVVFYTDQAPNPNGTHDVQSVALHEFGHNHALGHVTDLNYIMAPFVDDVDRMLEPADESGGEHAVRTSEENIVCMVNGQNFALSPMMPLAPCVNATNEFVGEKEILNILPNPNNGIFKISSAGSEFEKVEIFNIIGSTVFKRNIFGANELDITANLMPGLYFVKVHFDEIHSVTKTIVIQ